MKSGSTCEVCIKGNEEAASVMEVDRCFGGSVMVFRPSPPHASVCQASQSASMSGFRAPSADSMITDTFR